MTTKPLPKDLVILTADKQAQFALKGIFSRFKSLGICQLAPDYYVHPGKDPGVLRNAHDFLRPFTQSHRHALTGLWRFSPSVSSCKLIFCPPAEADCVGNGLDEKGPPA
jgi:hypothetical protein